MSIFSNFADYPNQIKNEGQEITIRFTRTSDTTAKITWNIPAPANGCNSENQAYDGIVVTISNTPANYTTTSPKDGVYYNADHTADKDLFTGDIIDSKAYVIGAFYHDKTTVELNIDGIQPKVPYYVSGYAVDAVGRYHREGVHAYSLPTGTQSFTTEDYPATHDISVYTHEPITLKTRTGLVAGTDYTLPIKVECKVRDFIINGEKALTYGMLVDEINRQFMAIESPFQGPYPKHSGDYFLKDSIVYKWSGHKIENVEYVELDHDPRIPVLGTYWIGSDGILRRYENTGWEIVDIIRSDDPPTELDNYDIWFDGITVRVWEGNHWCDYNTIFSDRNPQFPPELNVGDYWFNNELNEFFKWNEKTQSWDDALVIYYDIDPNLLTNGNYWYDEKQSKIKQMVNDKWSTLVGVLYVPSNDSGNFPDDLPYDIVAGTKWYDTKLNKFYERNLMNIDWDELRFVSFPTNPKNRKSCDLWWNSSETIDDLYVWENVSNSWITVQNFYRQTIDPITPPVLIEHSAWVTSDGEIYLIGPDNCQKVDTIFSLVDPRIIPTGSVWWNGSDYFGYDGTSWNTIHIIQYSNDPYLVFEGMLWFDTTNKKLYRMELSGWTEVCLYDQSILPRIDDLWYNSVDKLLFRWSGTAWLPEKPYLYVEFQKRSCDNKYERLVFKTSKTGCHEEFEVLESKNTLLSSLSNSIIYGDPMEGGSGLDAGVMYKQLGVGDDGSPDERRQLHSELRMLLGYPAIKSELSKQQIDLCIDNALLMLRKHSTYSYKRGMFFMNLRSNQQIYTLTNKCVGFNKIVDVLAIRRTKAGAFRTAYSQNDNFAYAALQQLYTLGTFDMLTFHMTSAYVEELETLFASRIMYQWLERSRELKIYQVPRSGERVLVEAIIERTEQELMTDRETAYWLKRWALNEAKGMLAQIRGKFQSLPGPNGTTVLNASELQAQVDAERMTLIEEIESKAMQDIVDIGMKTHFVMG